VFFVHIDCLLVASKSRRRRTVGNVAAKHPSPRRSSVRLGSHRDTTAPFEPPVVRALGRKLHPERAAVPLVVGVALLGSLAGVPRLLAGAKHELAAPNYSVPESDTDALRYFVSLAAARIAVENIPPGAMYTVRVGSGPPLPGDDDLAIQPALQFLLLPRRYTPRLGQARWVIAYHRPVSSIRVASSRQISLGADGTLIEVAR
jgi:hypothetical protein